MASLPPPILAFALLSQHLFYAAGPSIHSLDLTTGTALSSPSTPSSSTAPATYIRHLAISPDNLHAATISDDKALCVYAISSSGILLRSTRIIAKRASHLSFTPRGSILISDKTGDAYLYPLEPLAEAEGALKLQKLKQNADPSLNPDATLLLGHVSVLTAHQLTPDGRFFITADRDEHIRVSRFPQSFVIERYIFGSDGFVSALHIPDSRPGFLLSAGGEPLFRIWDWETGVLRGTVEIFSAVLPHRRVRSHMRKIKRPKKQPRVEASADESGERGFYEAPEGWVLPSGQGVCVKKIMTAEVEGELVVVFFSEGCAAVHAFVLPLDPSTDSPVIHTMSLPYPVLDITPVPSQPRRLLCSLDAAWGVLKTNSVPEDSPADGATELSEDQTKMLGQSLACLEINAEGRLSDISSSSTSLLDPILQSLCQPSLLTSQKALSTLDLYPDLSLLPRWPGLEEDDELAGPQPGPSRSEAGESIATGPPVGKAKKAWKWEELEMMGIKELGRLKAQGVEVGDLIWRKKKDLKAMGSGKRARQGGERKSGKGGRGGGEEEDFGNS